jgi:hypothetical protein
VSALVHSCPNLFQLTLAGANVTDASLSHISRLRRLQRLNLRYASVTGEGIQRLLHSCRDLFDLTFHEAKLTAGALEAISTWQSQHDYQMRPYDDGSLSVFDPKRF